MIALDTNVLVRFLVEDDQVQAARATALIKRAIEGDDRLFVADIVMCEAAWVLGTTYKTPRREIAAVFRRLVGARHLAFASTDALARALSAFETGKGDFADYLIREQAKAAGCAAVVTFDGALLKEPGFERP
ncbi:MAG: type II toxin-antitoxin system VapC family toxin [Myxococcales bacterium]